MSRCPLIPLLFLLLGMIGCTSDEEVLPPYRQDMAELYSDSDGKANIMCLDDGGERILNQAITGLVPDSLYRVFILYVEGESSITPVAVQQVISPFPKHYSQDEQKVAPLELQAMWMSKRYLNFLLRVQTGSGKQRLGFISHGIERLKDGRRKLNLQVFHDQMDDTPYYSQDVYMSCPLYQYVDSLTANRDSVEMTVQTYNGKIRRSYLYTIH